MSKTWYTKGEIYLCDTADSKGEIFTVAEDTDSAYINMTNENGKLRLLSSNMLKTKIGEKKMQDTQNKQQPDAQNQEVVANLNKTIDKLRSNLTEANREIQGLKVEINNHENRQKRDDKELNNLRKIDAELSVRNNELTNEVLKRGAVIGYLQDLIDGRTRDEARD